MSGRLIVVVGPSGAGKDTVIDALCAARPDLIRARRVITRPSEAGGEDFEGVTEADFNTRVAAGDFALHWGAHGLRYGIPVAIDTHLAAGRDVMFNGSRGILTTALARYPDMRTLFVTADADVLAARLTARGREDADDIARRLKRADYAMPAGVNMVRIDNNGTVQAAVDAALTALYPARV